MGQQARLVFDHEQDGRPRRQVADWGGDEVFARTPRRRFKQIVGGAESAHPAPRPHVAEPVRPRLHVVPSAEETAVELPAVDPPELIAELDLPVEDGFAAEVEERAPNGRRTVLITGRPGAHPAPRPEVDTSRRRPPRTVEERLGARPDRIAAWACGLGLTLILAAVATADAATRAL
jgi:hypothetical protein